MRRSQTTGCLVGLCLFAIIFTAIASMVCFGIISGMLNDERNRYWAEEGQKK